MAHEITIRTDGMAEMAWVGETPWHGLGQQLTEGATIEEFMSAAGMDWIINRSPVSYQAGRGAKATTEAFEGKTVLWRSDSKAPLGIVSPDYQIVQPYEVLEFFRAFADQAGAKLHTAGTLFGGSRMWGLAKLDEATIASWDRVGSYLLLTTSADGSIATTALPTTVRVVCNNTLTQALGGEPATPVKISHRQMFNADAVIKRLGTMREHFECMVEDIDALTKIRISSAAATDFVSKLLRASPLDEDSEAKRAHPGERIILDLFGGNGRGATKPGSSGTAWGLVNAVTEYVDHHTTAKSDSHRLTRAWYGAGADLKSEAFVTALTLV